MTLNPEAARAGVLRILMLRRPESSYFQARLRTPILILTDPEDSYPEAPSPEDSYPEAPSVFRTPIAKTPVQKTS